MKTLLAILSLSLLLVNLSPAATLEWDRNTEGDLKDYQVWACFTPSCVVIKSPSTLQATPVLQTLVGVKPSLVMDIANKEGSVAVSARDTSLNESGLSVPLGFDNVAPAVPTGPLFK